MDKIDWFQTATKHTEVYENKIHHFWDELNLDVWIPDSTRIQEWYVN